MRFFLRRFEEIVGVACLGIMVTVAFMNVLTRYFFRYSMAFTEEITLYLFVWVVMMGTSIAFREGSNMAVTLFYERFRREHRKYLALFASLLSTVFFVILAYFGIREVMDEIDMNAMTEAIEMPIWWFTSAMPIASVLILFRIIVRTRDDLQSGNY
jgi:TRAP-type C4-dicarboxylate transport system permease small subunit